MGLISEDEPWYAGGELEASGLPAFPRLEKATVDALRYRAEDVARSLTSKVIKEVSSFSLQHSTVRSQSV